MAFPNELLHNPEWHAKPIEEREKELSARDPEFAKFNQPRRRDILDKAARRYGAPARSAPPPPAPPAAPRGGVFSEAWRDAKLGFHSGVADLSRSVAGVADVAGKKEFARDAEGFAKDEEERASEAQGRRGFVSQVMQGAGAAVPAIVKYAPAEAAGKYAPLVAAGIGAISHVKEGPAAMAKAGVKDAIQFAGMRRAGRLASRPARAAASAAIAAGVTAVAEGGDLKQTAAAAVLGGGFGAISKGEKKSSIKLTAEQAHALLEGGVDGVSKARDLVRKAIAPQNRGPEARRQAGIVRANTSDIYRQADIAEHALKNASKEFRLMPDEDRMQIIHAIEQPNNPAHKLAPKMKGFVDAMREIHNQVRDELIEEGSYVDEETGEKKYTVLGGVKRAISGDPEATMQSYYENYFPHLFTDPNKAADLMRAMYAGKRPLEGPGTMLRQRKYPTIEEALSATDADGNPQLKLVTTDPVEAYMLKWREMKRFTAALRISKEMEESGLLKWVEPGKRGPQGWAEVKHSKAFVRIQRERSGETRAISGAWAPEAAARVLNNYLSPGLRGHSTVGPAFRGLMAMNNTLNQAQLGFSAFHLGFTAVDAVTSKAALGIEKLWEGYRHGSAKTAASGLKDIGKAVTLVPALAENLRIGRKMRQEWIKPGSTDQHTAQLVSMMQEAGGGLSLDPVYRTNMRHRMYEAMRQHGGFVGALLGDAAFIPKALLAGNEGFASLIMNQVVPWQKLGVFADLAQFEMGRLPEGAPHAQVREVMGKAWDSVDNRMGMLRYDNLFWEKWIKDMSMVTMRSVGWNLGTIRELGGGVMDWREQAARAVKQRTPKAAEMTHRMAYTIAMPAITGMIGGMIHYAYNGKAPEQLLDWFFPRVGRKDEFGRDERISVPSYVKDVYHLGEAAGDLASGAGTKKSSALFASKLHSSWGVIADMLNNRDFYNTEIANSGDPFMKQMLSYGEFYLKQYDPFSFVNISRQRKMGMPVAEQVGTLVGFVPAPGDIKKTRAERVATDIMAESLPRRANTAEDRERQDTRRELERKIRMGDNWQSYARQQIDSGVLSDDDVVHAADRSSGIPLDRSVERMRLQDLPRVWKVANPEERQRLRPIILNKVERSAESIAKLPEKQRRKLMTEIWSMVN